MEKTVWDRILEVQDAALEDAEYRELYREYMPAEEDFRSLFLRLSERQRNIIGDYLQAAVALHHRLLGIACSDNQKKSG